MKKVVVTSPMRTGSTMVFDTTKRILSSSNHQILMQEEDLLRNLSTIAKTHCLDSSNIIRFSAVHPDAKVILCLRNFKDSLISRLMYCREISKEKEGIARIRKALFGPCLDMSDEEYVRWVIDNEWKVIQKLLDETKSFWFLGSIAKDRFDNIHVVTYEEFMHDTRAAIEKIAAFLGVVHSQSEATIWTRQNSPHLARTNKPENFAKRCLAGYWVDWLTKEQSDKIDNYFYGTP